MKKSVVIAAISLMTMACSGGEESLTAPTPSIPNVVGNYSGTTTFVLPEIGERETCPTTTSVTQSGSVVSIAPLVLGGVCGGMSIPFGSVNIDATGSLGNATTTHRDTCGVYNLTGSGGFFGRDLRLSITGTSTTCWNFNMTTNLSR